MKNWTIATLFLGLAACTFGLGAVLADGPVNDGMSGAWQEEGEIGTELPPIFEAGAKLTDAHRREYYEIKEIRGEWFRADHYMIRGDATDLLASNAWVYAPGKGWDWVAYK
ncbi:MAG: hypothetical protein ACYTFG_17450 [Planctomycetota bacterium]|jgi:hypothetical protein